MPERGQPDGSPVLDDDSGSVNTDEALHHGAQLRETSLWELSGRVSKQEDEYYASPPKWRWFWKTPLYTFGCGIPAILGIVGQFAVPALDRACGQPLGDKADLLRTIMLFGGFFMLMLASPVYRSKDWKPTQDVQALADREAFRNKFGR